MSAMPAQPSASVMPRGEHSRSLIDRAGALTSHTPSSLGSESLENYVKRLEFDGKTDS